MPAFLLYTLLLQTSRLDFCPDAIIVINVGYRGLILCLNILRA
jgi:hypothetical protein